LKGITVLKVIKNYFLEKLLDTRLYFIKEKSQEIHFIDLLQTVKKILIILPLNKNEENIARQHLPKLHDLFSGSHISTLDMSSLQRNDTNWLGIPNNQYLANIKNENFDLLIDLNSNHERICTYLGALTEAPLRLHLSEGKFNKIYNLQIRTDDKAPITTRYHNLINYLFLMRKKVEETK